jgi:hypothetical protein
MVFAEDETKGGRSGCCPVPSRDLLWASGGLYCTGQAQGAWRVTRMAAFWRTHSRQAWQPLESAPDRCPRDSRAPAPVHRQCRCLASLRCSGAPIAGKRAGWRCGLCTATRPAAPRGASGGHAIDTAPLAPAMAAGAAARCGAAAGLLQRLLKQPHCNGPCMTWPQV